MYSAWPKTNAMSSFAHKSASQVPREDAFQSNDDVITIWRNGSQVGPFPLDPECIRTWTERANRCHNSACVAWCRIS
jgi:hypothetical protein